MADKVTNLELEDIELKIVEYAVQQYVNKIQEVIASEHSGVGRFMLESNLINANNILAKLSPAVEAPEPVYSDESSEI